MFGRAALLGYNSRGDPRSCTTAYPTCPQDPDQLINYLNNHNGGFFRFFNQQLPQYAPQYAPVRGQPPYPPQSPFNPQRPFNHNPNYPANYAPGYPSNYAPNNYVPPQQHFGYKTRSDRAGNQQSPRILSGSASQYYDVPSVQDLPLNSYRPPMTFPEDDQHGANSVVPFTFPTNHRDRQAKRVKMIFPDRTGTGGLRADVDQYGNYKGVYYADGAIKFVDEGDDNKRPSKIRLPAAAEFDVSNRLPYPGHRRPNNFQFPRTE